MELVDRENSRSADEKINKNETFVRKAVAKLFPNDDFAQLSDDVTVLCRHSEHACSVALLLEEAFNSRSAAFLPLLLATSLEESGRDVIDALPLLLTLDDVTMKAKESPPLLLTCLGFEKSPSSSGLDVNEIIPLLISGSDDVIMSIFNATRPNDVTPYLMTSQSEVERMARFLIVSGFNADRIERIIPFLFSEEGFLIRNY